MHRDETGRWSLDEPSEKAKRDSHPSYFEALPRYLTALDFAFERARAASEFHFLLSIFAIRSMQDAGWDAYETTLQAVDSVRSAIREMDADVSLKHGNTSRHLTLWLYGHIMEAAEPYEFLSNLIDVSAGGGFQGLRFPPKKNGSPRSPGEKIDGLGKQAVAAGIPDVVVPMKEAWNREFRNSIFHADYTLHGPETRTMRPSRRYDHDQTMTLINRALAYHDAMSALRTISIESYEDPVQIPCGAGFSPDPREMAEVIVRDGFGAVGLKHAWTAEELKRGRIPFRMGRFTAEEMALMDASPTLARLPARAT